MLQVWYTFEPDSPQSKQPFYSFEVDSPQSKPPLYLRKPAGPRFMSAAEPRTEEENQGQGEGRGVTWLEPEHRWVVVKLEGVGNKILGYLVVFLHLQPAKKLIS